MEITMASVIPRPGYGYEVRYIDPATGKRRSKTCKLKKEADAFMRKVQREIEDGVHVARSEGKSVREVGKLFLEWQAGKVKNGTLGRSRAVVCEGVIRNHIVPAIGSVLISEMKWADVETLRRAIAAKSLAPMSVKHIMGLMKQIEDFARKREWTKVRVVQDVNRDHGGAKAAVVEVPTPDEVRRIMMAAGVPRRLPGRKGCTVHERSARLRECYIYLAALCGLRFGEISALTRDSIDLEKCVLRIRHAMTKWDDMKGPKTCAGVRDVPLPQLVADLLAAWLRDHVVPEPRGLVFRSSTGGMIRNSSFYSHHWGPLLAAAGFQSKGPGTFHFHALRHFAGSMMLHYGMPLPEVSATLGHQKFDMTLQVYIHRIAAGNGSNEVAERMAASPLLRLSDATGTQTHVNA
jgi:integrase